MQIIQGDLLASDCTVLVHQTNCRGVMGGGIARQIAQTYPEILEPYRALCHEAKQKLGGSATLLGKVQLLQTTNGRMIANVFSQDDFGTTPTRPVLTDYHALEKGLLTIRSAMQNTQAKVGIPVRIGCGLAGGDWENVVYPMIQSIFDPRNCEGFTVVLYEYA